MGANAGTCILLDQSLQDYRDVVGAYQLPTLLAWGRDEKLIPVASGECLAERVPGELVVFERSGHCPMWRSPTASTRSSATGSQSSDATSGAPRRMPRTPTTGQRAKNAWMRNPNTTAAPIGRSAPPGCSSMPW